MLLSVGLIVLGLLVLVAGGEALLRGAVGLATLARLTPAVIGLTVVAAGTSVPELAVSVVAATQDKTAITVGNVVGSNIFNLTMVIGIAALVRPLAISGNTVRLEYPVLVLVTLLCVAVADHGQIHRMDATLFLAVYVGFMAYLVSLVRRQMTAGETSQLTAETAALAEVAHRPPRLWMSLVFVAVGAGLLAWGAELTIRGAVRVGEALGMSEEVIGLTIVAIGTGLPELVTSLVSSFRGRDDVAIANVIGSNLFNILGILGISALVTSPLEFAAEIATIDNRWMLGITLLLFPLMFTGRRVNRWEGVLLLLGYAVYMGFVLDRNQLLPL